jgi:hypothetical protein
MPHLPHAHHGTSKRDSLNETRIKEKQNETVPDSNSNLAKSMTHHNQTKELTTWFDRCRPPENWEKKFGPPQPKSLNSTFDSKSDYHHPRGGYTNRG